MIFTYKKKVLPGLMLVLLSISTSNLMLASMPHRKDFEKACPLGLGTTALSSIFVGLSVAKVIDVSTDRHSLVRDLMPELGIFSAAATFGILSKYKPSPFPLSKKQAVLGALCSGLVTGLLAHNDIDSANIKAGIITTMVVLTGLILNEYTPEAVSSHALSELDDRFSEELSTKLSLSDHEFLSFVKDKYSYSSWPLVEVYDELSDARYHTLKLAHIFKTIRDYCFESGDYPELQAIAREKFEALQLFNDQSKRVLELLKQQPSFAQDAHLQNEFLLKNKQEQESRIRTNKEINGYLEIVHNVVDLFRDKKRNK